MSSPEEIWSTRLQKELLALTSDDDQNNKKDIGVLPPFITVKEHNLNLTDGKCTISFGIEVDVVKPAVDNNENDIDNDIDNDKVTNEKAESKEEGSEETVDKNSSEEDKTTTDNAATSTETSVPSTSTPTPTTTTTTAEVIVTLDASLQYRFGSNTPDSSLSYPFFKPKAFISSGSEILPSSAQIQNGGLLQIDCDWTPSLHLNDAALNIALKVRESVRRGEGCLKLEQDVAKAEEDDSFDTKVSSFFSSLKTRATAIVEEVDSKIDVAMREKPSVLKKMKEKASVVKEKASAAKDKAKANAKAAPTPTKVVTEENVKIGDLIDLSQSPWNNAVGMYPCRAIRRPDFVEEAMKRAEKSNTTKVAGSGFTGAGSMFKSFSMQAKSLVEESFLVLTKELMLEIKCSKFSVSTATVSFYIPISHLSKLKFRREESISLFFKPTPDDPIIYMCPSSADAVKQIQAVLKQHGVKGKHTNATMIKAVQIATEMLADIKEREMFLREDPRPEKVTEIMDLYRQAAEKFEMAGDKRHEEVMTLMRDFLAQPHVSGVLDGSIKPKEEATLDQSAILEPIDDESELDQSIDHDIEDMNQDTKSGNDEDLDNMMKAAEDMLNDAHDELKDLGVSGEEMENAIEDDVKNDALDAKLPSSTTSDSKDVVSEFEDMLADADKELEELINA